MGLTRIEDGPLSVFSLFGIIEQVLEKTAAGASMDKVNIGAQIWVGGDNPAFAGHALVYPLGRVIGATGCLRRDHAIRSERRFRGRRG